MELCLALGFEMGTAVSAKQLVGTLLGKAYHLSHLVAESEVTATYEAGSDLHPGKQLVVKVAFMDRVDSPAVFNEYRAVADRASGLNHRNIHSPISFHGIGSFAPFSVSEALPGVSLAERIAQCGRYTPVQWLPMLGQLVSALQSAHAEGVFHGGLTPGIIILQDVEGEVPSVKILDFGFSRICKTTTRNILNQDAADAVAYLAPEQVSGEGKTSTATDLFALGVLTYEALSGERPFSAPLVTGIIYKITQGWYKPLTSAAPDLPESFNNLMNVALSKEPEERYPSAEAFLDDFRAAMDELPLSRAITVAEFEPFSLADVDGAEEPGREALNQDAPSDYSQNARPDQIVMIPDGKKADDRSDTGQYGAVASRKKTLMYGEVPQVETPSVVVQPQLVAEAGLSPPVPAETPAKTSARQSSATAQLPRVDVRAPGAASEESTRERSGERQGSGAFDEPGQDSDSWIMTAAGSQPRKPRIKVSSKGPYLLLFLAALFLVGVGVFIATGGNEAGTGRAGQAETDLVKPLTESLPSKSVESPGAHDSTEIDVSTILMPDPGEEKVPPTPAQKIASAPERPQVVSSPASSRRRIRRAPVRERQEDQGIKIENYMSNGSREETTAPAEVKEPDAGQARVEGSSEDDEDDEGFETLVEPGFMREPDAG